MKRKFYLDKGDVSIICLLLSVIIYLYFFNDDRTLATTMRNISIFLAICSSVLAVFSIYDIAKSIFNSNKH